MKKLIKRVIIVCLAFIPISAISIRAHVVKLGIDTAIAGPTSGFKDTGTSGAQN